MDTKRILVIDDDEGIRVTIEAALDDCHVVTVESAVGAVPLLRSQDFDAIICDLVMPVMTGPELFESLPLRSPLRERFLFVTGGNAPTSLQSFVLLAGRPVLKKPFSITLLRESLALVLASNATERVPAE